MTYRHETDDHSPSEIATGWGLSIAGGLVLWAGVALAATSIMGGGLWIGRVESKRIELLAQERGSVAPRTVTMASAAAQFGDAR